MEGFLTALQATPIPTMLIITGLGLVILSVVSQIPPQDDEPPLLVPKQWPAFLGILICLVGVLLFPPPALLWPR